MKICLLLTGHYRTFDKTFPIWKNKFIDEYSADVYMHIYSNKGNRLDLNKNELSPPAGSKANAVFDDESIDIEKIKQKYSIKNLIVEDYKGVEAKENFINRTAPIKQEFLRRGMGDRRIQWFLSQYYKRLEGINWVLNSQIKYDFVLLSRPDFCLGVDPPRSYGFTGSGYCNKIPFDKMKKDHLYMTLLNHIDGFHDFYAIASPDYLLNFGKIYNNFENLFEFFKKTNFEGMSCGHSLLTNYVQLANLNVEQIGLLGYIIR